MWVTEDPRRHQLGLLPRPVRKRYQAAGDTRESLMRGSFPLRWDCEAVWTWSQEREQDRLTKRARLAALYVNPFMSACEDLQSRIYNILELRGLHKMRGAIQTELMPREILYLIVRYFGWAAALCATAPTLRTLS
jgi:hypothetical protein